MLAYVSINDIAIPSFIGEALAHIVDTATVELEGSLQDDGSTLLHTPAKVDVFSFGGTVYAFVTSYNEHGIQAISLADPSNPSATSNVADNSWRQMQGAHDIGLFVHESRNLLGVVTGTLDNGINMVNVTDPSNIRSIGRLQDNSTYALSNPAGVAIFQRDGTNYAAVASIANHGVQIVDLSDPTSPARLDSITADGNTLLRESFGIKTYDTHDGNYTYAVVTARQDNAVQILNLTDVDNIRAVSNLADPPNSTRTAGSSG